MKQLKRFDQIIQFNQSKDYVLGFIGFGSMHHKHRLDAYSDIDFFIIVDDDYKETFLKDISWLEVAPIAWWYQETKDGLKVIYNDGIFLEFAVFTQSELSGIPFETGTVYYLKEGVSEHIFAPKQLPKKDIDKTYVFNTWLSNLYIGLLREMRGEKVAAFLMIQVYASHHFLTLLNPKVDDPFVVERRIESRLSLDYEVLYAGYQGNMDSAKYQLLVLDETFEIPEIFEQSFKDIFAFLEEKNNEKNNHF